MSKFVPRTSAPSATDKHWIKTSKGGLNECIEISGGSVLPNCVGYAWGRFYELTGTRPKLSTGNAENWYANTADGYKRSSAPKLGAVACWRKGQVYNEADGCGHVAIVEEIKPNGDIVCSNSAYGGSRFYMKTYSKSAGYNSGALTFQGFILPPVDFEEPPAEPSGEFKVGDIVEFTGSTHYTTSVGATGLPAKPGKARITIISPGSAHPYHLINEGGGCTVYGWVDSADIKGSASAAVKVGDTVTVKSGAKTYYGGSLASFVYSTKYTVTELVRDRAVISYGNVVVAAVNVKDLTPA